MTEFLLIALAALMETAPDWTGAAQFTGYFSTAVRCGIGGLKAKKGGAGFDPNPTLDAGIRAAR
jgi:hypothetical protein